MIALNLPLPKRSVALFVFLSTFAALLFLKHDTIFQPVLMSDDLIYFTKSTFGHIWDSASEPFGYLHFSVAVHVLKSPIFMKLYYAALMSITAALIFSLFYQFFEKIRTVREGFDEGRG